MGGKSKAQTVGYHYRPAFHVGLVGRMIDAFLEYRAADKTAWAGELTASGRIQIDAPDLFGGEKDQGGIVGPVDVMFGEPDQVPNPYLVEVFGAQTVAWRGMTTLVFAGGRFGAMNPYQQKSAYKIRKILNGWDGEPWYPIKAAIPLLPAEILTPDLSFPATQAAMGPYAGITFDSGFGASDTIIVEKPLGLTYRAWSPWSSDSSPSAGGLPWTNQFSVTDEHGQTVEFWGGYSSTSIDAEAAVGGGYVGLSGSSSYTFWLRDTPVNDNRGGLSLRIYRAGLVGINPAHLLYCVRTDSEKGAEPRSSLNEASFIASADRLHEEGFGLCQVVYDPERDTPDSMTERICRIIGGSLERSLVDGQWYLDLARGIYDLDSLPVMADADILEIKRQPTTLHGVTNSLSIRYFDPERKESIITPAVRALGLIRAFGEIHETLDFPEIPTSQLALRVAERELRARITPTEGFEVVSRPRPELIALRRGQYFRLQSPKRGIVDMVCIVGEKDAGALRSGAVRWKAAQDIYSMPVTTYVQVEEGVDVRPPQTPAPIEHGRALEAPYIDVVSSLPRAELEALPPDVGFLLGVAARPGHGLDYTMAVRVEGGGFEPLATGEWCPTATTASPIERGMEPVVVPLASVRGLDRVPVGAAVLMGEEILRLDVKQLDPPQVRLARGCADTVPSSHAAGARMWFLGDDLAVDTTEYSDGEEVEVKLLTNTGSQQLPIEAATTLPIVFVGRQARPYPPAEVLINGVPNPISVLGDAVFTWAHRDRQLQADQLFDQVAGDIGPEPGTTYTIENYDEDTETLLHSESGITGTTYTLAAQHMTVRNRAEVYAVRGELESWQRHRIRFVTGHEITGDVLGAVNHATYSLDLHADEAMTPVQWSIAAGSLPAGLHLATNTGTTTTIFGVADDTPGYYTVLIMARSVSGAVAYREITIGLGNMGSLLHFDGADGQTTFTDETGRAWTHSGAAQIRTAESRFGGSSLWLQPSSWLRTAADALQFGNEDFTIAVWFRIENLSQSQRFIACQRTGYTNQHALSMLVRSDADIRVQTSLTGGAPIIGLSAYPGVIEAQKWAHLVFQRRGDIIEVAVDGVFSDSRVVGTSPLFNGTQQLQLGAVDPGRTPGEWYYGYLDEWSIVRGAGLYQGDFTPPDSPSDYPQPAPVLAVNGSLPAGATSMAYSSLTDITIHGAHSPFSIGVSAGVLPGDWAVAINGHHVEVTGSGIVAGTYTFTLEIEDAYANTVYLPLTVQISD